MIYIREQALVIIQAVIMYLHFEHKVHYKLVTVIGILCLSSFYFDQLLFFKICRKMLFKFVRKCMR
jgi:hypothetical protein